MERCKSWFKYSTTILWARVQLFAAALWGALSVTDLTPLLSPKWVPVWLVISGTITELTRRRTLEKE
jgi:hypothetical protein